MKTVYLDHAATTSVRDEVLEAMLPYFKDSFGNASSVHSFGREAKKALDTARETVAEILNADFNEIIFTSGGTESNNLAIKGVAHQYKQRGMHLITSAIEHPAVLNPMKELEKEGFTVTYLPVNEQGIVSVEAFQNAVRDDTILVSIMHANNEIGTIQPIAAIGKIARERGILMHTDAVQSVGYLNIDVDDLNVDLLTLSAHKIYGPKGVGALYVRKGVQLVPQIRGGAQERRKRAGTENTAGIVGLAKALELAHREQAAVVPKIEKLRDRLLEGILQIPHTRLNGSRTERLPNNINVCFEFIEGESLLLNLDLKGLLVPAARRVLLAH